VSGRLSPGWLWVLRGFALVASMFSGTYTDPTDYEHAQPMSRRTALRLLLVIAALIGLAILLVQLFL
jgi:hypothetical protein